MTFKHGEMTHRELFAQGVVNTCQATSLDGVLDRHDVSLGYYKECDALYDDLSERVG